MIKRSLLVVLCIVFCLSFVPVVSAQQPVVTFSFSQEEVTVGDTFTITISAQGDNVTNLTGQLAVNPYINFDTSKMGFDTSTARYIVSFDPSQGDIVIQCTAKRKGSITMTLADVQVTNQTGTIKADDVSDAVRVRPVYTPIYTKEELYNIRNNLEGDYMLMNDIVFSQEDFQEGGAFYDDGFGWRPIGAVVMAPFKGSFNGNGYSIQGLVMNKAYYNFGGLFGVNKGEIENLRIKDAVIDGEYGLNTSVYADGSPVNSGGNGTDVDYEDKDVWTPPDTSVTEESLNQYDRTGTSTATVGILCGYNMGSVTDCFVGGEISGNTYVGGLVGRNAGTITGCGVNVAVTGKKVAGGISGTTAYTSRISDSVSQGSVDALVAGGIIGEAKGSVVRAYTVCSVTGNTSGTDFGSGSPTVSEVYTPSQQELNTLTFTAGNWSYDKIMPYPSALADLLPVKDTVVKGDADGNGVVDPADLAAMKLYLAGNNTPVQAGADMNDDNVVNISDLSLLKLKLAGA